MAVAPRLHPAWHRCWRSVRKLHARIAVILGAGLDRLVDAVVAWTPGGTIAGDAGMAICIATEAGIPS